MQFNKRTFVTVGVLVVLMITTATAFVLTKSRPAVASSGTKLFHTYSSKETAQAAIKASKVMVFSKTFCPYCVKAKAALTKISPLFSVVELDVIKDGPEMQAALLEMTGQKTVPSIFVNGQHIGGCDATLALIASGEFQKMLA